MQEFESTLLVSGQALVERPIAAPDRTVRDFMQSAPVAFCNLEAAAAAAGAYASKPGTVHLTSPEAIGALALLGFRVLAHANNHAFDHGPPGILATHAAAAANGLAIVGSGRDAAQAGAAAVVAAGQRRFAFLAADCGPQPDIAYAAGDRPGINPLRAKRQLILPESQFEVLRTILAAVGEDRRQSGRAAIGYREAIPGGTLDFFGTPVTCGNATADARIQDAADLAGFLSRLAVARQEADVVAVSLHHHHWAVDWSETPGWFLSLAALLIDHGADVIVGTGTPVLQPIRFHRGKPILAGLGNLIFHTHRPRRYDDNDLDVWTGALCRCVFSGAEFLRVEILPIAVGRPEAQPNGLMPAPTPLSGSAAKSVYARLTKGLEGEDRPRCVLA